MAAYSFAAASSGAAMGPRAALLLAGALLLAALVPEASAVAGGRPAAAAPDHARGTRFPRYFEEEEEDDEPTAMLQVNIASRAPMKRVTGVQQHADRAFDGLEEEEEETMFFQSSMVGKPAAAQRPKVEELEFDESSI
uniref:Uncharacterized protein n=1 Tax=Zooxanthella nutricula TaxID=1333877 RepID=A0A7S2K960_9DINO